MLYISKVKGVTAMDTLALFGRHLRKMRKAQGLTQEKLAEKCGLYYPHVGAIERGEKNVSLLTIEKLAKGLDTTMSNLLAIPAFEKSGRGKLVAMISEASPQTQKRLYQGIRYLID